MKLSTSFVRFEPSKVEQVSNLSSQNVLVVGRTGVAGVERLFLVCPNFKHLGVVVQGENLGLIVAYRDYTVGRVLTELTGKQVGRGLLN